MVVVVVLVLLRLLNKEGIPDDAGRSDVDVSGASDVASVEVMDPAGTFNDSVLFFSSTSTVARSPKEFSIKDGSVVPGSSEIASLAIKSAVDASTVVGVVVPVVDVLLLGGRSVTLSSRWLSVCWVTGNGVVVLLRDPIGKIGLAVGSSTRFSTAGTSSGFAVVVVRRRDENGLRPPNS